MSLPLNEARQIIAVRGWNFVDLCDLVEAYATLTDGSLEWTSPRVNVLIKRKPPRKKAKPAKKVVKP